MSRIRLRVSNRDAALVEAQGATKRGRKPFAHAFGKSAASNAALIVTAVNCHQHMVKALQHTLRTAQHQGDARVRLRLVARFAKAALARLES